MMMSMTNRTRSYTKMMVAAVVAAVCAAYSQQTKPLSAFQADAKSTSVADGIYSADQAKRGQAKYAQVCSSCHQGDLSGSDQAPGLAGGDFLDRWDGQSVADLADRIRTSMPADDVGSLTTQMSVDIVAYMLQVNRLPAGAEEMKPDRAALRTVMFKKK